MNTFWEGKKVLIAGASGFIGKGLMIEVLKRGAFPIGMYHLHKPVLGDLLGAKFIKQDLKTSIQKNSLLKNIDVIINAAGLDGNFEFKKKNGALLFDTNIRIALNILNFAKTNNVPTVVLISSAEIYPSLSKRLIEGNDYTKFADLENNGYVLSKRTIESIGKIYEKQYGISVLLPRLTNVYGPGEQFLKEDRVISRLISKMLKSEPVQIWGNGEQEHTFLYIDDCVVNILDMIEYSKNHTINISTHEKISINKLARLIKTFTKSRSEVTNIDMGVTQPASLIPTSTKMYSFTRHKPRTLRKGLIQTIAWYKTISSK